MSKASLGRRYNETDRALIATVLGTMGYVGTQTLLTTAPTRPTLESIAKEYGIRVPESPSGSRTATGRISRYTDAERALIATILGDLGYTGTQGLMSTSPTYPTLRVIADEYDVRAPRTARKATSAKAKKKGNPKRSRRYNEDDRARIAKIIESNGLSGTFKILGDETPSMVTLHNIAKDAGIELHRGRPTTKKAA